LEDSKRERSLKEAKFFLINGETELARQSLFGLLRKNEGKYGAVMKRYLALADFQDGRWKEALAHLSAPEVMTYPQYGRVCPLRVVLRVAVQDTLDLKDEWTRCKLENTKDLFLKDMVWMELMVDLSTRAP